jgi:hypothetical protein
MFKSLTQPVIKEKSRLTFSGRRENDSLIQELLIQAAYHALRGNSDPLNDILADAVQSNTTRIQGITLWVELNLPVRVKDEKFKLNKKWVESEVKSEAEFEINVLPKLTIGPKWWEVARAPKAASIWDMGKYLDRVVDTLKDHGKPEAAKEVLAAIARINSAVD